jgi:cytochrome c oxidase subunit 2
MPDDVSNYGGEVDGLFYFIYWVCVLMFVLILGWMVLFVVRYRKRDGYVANKPAPHHSTTLELTWSIIPSIVVMGIFYFGFKGFLDMATPPKHAYEIQVIAKKWNWSFVYPNGHVDGELHVPVDTPVRLVLQSDDVIHSMFIPAFRIKKDAVPGRYTKTWFTATKQGQYNLFCAEYCGQQHSVMRTHVVVHNAGEFEGWLTDASNFLKKMAPAAAGEKIYNSRGCAQCHTTDGNRSTGPSFKDLFGREETFKDGSKLIVDEQYIHESVLEPSAKVVASFENVMPTYKGQLKDSEITALIMFFKSISKHYEGVIPTEPLEKDEQPAQTEGQQ